MIRYTKAYIERLLEKYMDGTTTLEEEDQLARYFQGKDVPGEWADYRQLFQEIAAMKPRSKHPVGRWIGWGIAAAAVVSGVIFMMNPLAQTTEPQGSSLTAAADTAIALPVEERPVRLVADTVTPRQERSIPVPKLKRSKRKRVPTIHDYDKAYALMAEAHQEQEEAEWLVEESRLAAVKELMEAMGYASVRHEDGTIEFINENQTYTAYEE